MCRILYFLVPLNEDQVVVVITLVVPVTETVVEEAAEERQAEDIVEVKHTCMGKTETEF